VDAQTRALELVTVYDEELRRLLPEGADIFDAHTHLGNDIDGMVGHYEELETIMDRFGVSRCFFFCLDEPDRHPGFRAANDRTLEFGARSAGRMIPFVRLDLSESPIEEAERCLDRGARGIKLHPRAQKFGLDDGRLAPVFALAAERRVPILIHGGRGLPPIADHLHKLVDTYPEAQLIIAHAGIADLAGLAGHFAGKAGVFFDTSVWSPIDLLSFFRLVPPEQAAELQDAAKSPALIESAIRQLNRAIVLLNFRREPIYLPEDSLLLQPRFRRYAIACRKLPELVRLRSSFLGRAIHTSPEAWQKQFECYLAKA